jgi:riboflavin synthase alpha subunit
MLRLILGTIFLGALYTLVCELIKMTKRRTKIKSKEGELDEVNIETDVLNLEDQIQKKRKLNDTKRNNLKTREGDNNE